ncbi:hypothetical protein ACTXT7_017531, partial [Hymenolepis weldensis]
RLANGPAGNCAGSPEFQDSKVEGDHMRPDRSLLDSFSVHKMRLHTENGIVRDDTP